MLKISDEIITVEPLHKGSCSYKVTKLNGTTNFIKVFPVSVKPGDPGFLAFKREAEKLKEAGNEHGTHLPMIVNYGLTKGGSFPFIEMNIVGGPDLAELAAASNGLVELEEVARIAEEISHTLAYCHNQGLVHGSIKAGNIRKGKDGHYVLLGISPWWQSDEKKKSTRAGDLRQIGLLMLQLITGKIPSPDRNGPLTGEEIILQRKAALPSQWPKEKLATEQKIPHWMMVLISKCLHNDADEQFADAAELYYFILEHHKVVPDQNKWFRSYSQYKKPESDQEGSKKNPGKENYFLSLRSFFQRKKSRPATLIMAGLLILGTWWP